jgi:hypothetical protein
MEISEVFVLLAVGLRLCFWMVLQNSALGSMHITTLEPVLANWMLVTQL